MATTKPVKKKAYKFPKHLGACADRLYELKLLRAAKQKEADLLEDEEKALKQHMIDTLPKSQASGVSGKLANAKAFTKQVPTVKDWSKLWKHIQKTGEFDLLQKRVSDSAVQERWENRKKVPGVEPFGAVVISLTKL